MRQKGSKNKKLKPLKNKDSVHRSLQLKAFFISFPLLGLLGFVALGIVGIILAAVVSSVVAFISVAASERIGGTAGKLYGGKKPKWSLQERFSADLSRARVQKMDKKYDNALIIVEKILAQQSDFNEALLLKAQILSEGFRETQEAKKCLVKILQTEPKDTSLCRWAESLYKELVQQPNKNLI